MPSKFWLEFNYEQNEMKTNGKEISIFTDYTASTNFNWNSKDRYHTRAKDKSKTKKNMK